MYIFEKFSNYLCIVSMISQETYIDIIKNINPPTPPTVFQLHLSKPQEFMQ